MLCSFPNIQKVRLLSFLFFFFNDTATTEIYTLSLHDALPISLRVLIATELASAGALAAGLSWAAPATAALFLAFAALTAAALLSGRNGRPCACFSSHSRLGVWTPLRALALALAAAALASGRLPDAASHYDRLLTAGLCVSLAASAALAAALLALAREVGVLRLDMSARGALEIADEGPALGAEHEWAAALPAG